jgi:glycosyltransferase involved in cell wall biosynthesis
MSKRRVLVLAPFFSGEGSWLDDFCPRKDLEFRKAMFPTRLPDWHQRGATTPVGHWLDYFAYTHRAMRWRADCIVTSFPQLAFVAAALARLPASPRPRLIAWNFNLGSVARRWKGRVAGTVLARTDRFIVHARGEIATYARWLGLEESRFRFVPLQRGRVSPLPPSPVAGRYFVSMGSANRDYATLIEAVRGTGIHLVLIAKRAIAEALPDVPSVVKLHGLSQEACNSILSGALANIVPIADTQTASGQVTFTTAMRLGVPNVATRCIGTVDYVTHGETGLLVPPGDAGALRAAMDALWRDEGLRRRIGEAGKRHADEHFSDEAAGRMLGHVIDEVLAGHA